MLNALRGFHDILPPQSEKFFYFAKVCEDVSKNYGFSKVNLPLLEEKALFARCVGESSDIASKEMYEFIDKGDNSVSLRPEGTAGAVRAFIEAKLDRAGGMHRWSYFGAMFRYERPQKGRLRQFHQFGVESFGEPSVYEDAQIIAMTNAIFIKLGIDSYVKINSLGCPKCAPQYKNKLISFANELSLCDDCNRRLKTNPLRILDCKNTSCKEALSSVPKITDCLCDECDSDFEILKNMLLSLNINFEIDKSLVRGLDYYTKTAFEFVANTGGSQNAIAGGGRYDGLIAQLDGKPTPAVGMAIGIERTLDLITLDTPERDGYYLGSLDYSTVTNIILLANKLRESNITFVSNAPKSLKIHLKNADKANARYCLIIGENEASSNSVWVKDMLLGVEKSVQMDELASPILCDMH